MTTSVFSTAYTRGTRTSNKYLLVIVHENGLGFCRLGLSVGKKLGNAVSRNLIKRRLRYIYFDLLRRSPMKSLDILVIVKRSERPPSYQVLRSELKRLLEKAGVL